MSLNNGKTRYINLRTRYNDKTKHSQICVTAILNLLRKVVPDDARCLVALTTYDLYGDDTDLFIAGLSMGNCRVAAFSLYRYDPYLTFNDTNWFDCKLKNTSKSNIQIAERRNLLLLRACRLLTHEICHLFGIDHCIFYSCLMNGSGDLGKILFKKTDKEFLF
jgi:archaemetzincin